MRKAMTMPNNTDLNPGDPVARQDLPAIVGVLVSLRNGWAKVRWSAHFSQWIFSARLTKPTNEEKSV